MLFISVHVVSATIFLVYILSALITSSHDIACVWKLDFPLLLFAQAVVLFIVIVLEVFSSILSNGDTHSDDHDNIKKLYKVKHFVHYSVTTRRVDKL